MPDEAVLAIRTPDTSGAKSEEGCPPPGLCWPRRAATKQQKGKKASRRDSSPEPDDSADETADERFERRVPCTSRCLPLARDEVRVAEE
jgi:hypothetical protein